MFRNLSKFPVRRCFAYNNVRSVSHTLNFQGTFPGILRKSIIQAWRPIFAQPTNLSERHENIDESSCYERFLKHLGVGCEPKTVFVSPTFEILNKYASKVESSRKGGTKKAKFSFKTAGKIRKFIRDKQCAFFGTNRVLRCNCKKGSEDVDAEKAKKKRKKPKKDLAGPCPYIKEECLRGGGKTGGGKKGPCKPQKKGHCKKAAACKKKGDVKKPCGTKVSKTVCKKGGASSKSPCKKPDKPRCSSAGSAKKSPSKPTCQKGGDKKGGKRVCKPKSKGSCGKKKEDSCKKKKKEDPCKTKKKNTCKKKNKEDPCKTKKKENTCKKKQKEDPCKAKKKENTCKKKTEDPCKKKEDSCKKAKEDPCKKKEDSCKKAKEDPCKKKEDTCKKKMSCVKGGASGDPCEGLSPEEKRKCERERDNWLKKKACWEKRWKK